MIRALVFDFDGLILDTETPLIDAFADVHASHDKPFDRERFISSVGEDGYSFDPWKAFGQRSDRSDLEAEMQFYKRIRILAQPVLPGVIPMMDAAKTLGIPFALASNSNHAHCEGHLQRLGLLDRFAFIACREDVVNPKPEPDIYRLASSRLGARAHEALAFEDSNIGSRAAKRAGLRCVAIPNASTAHHDFSHVDLKVASMAELKLEELVKKFGGK